MLDLIKIAWGIEPAKILGGPNWLAFNRFDISAKGAPSTPAATINVLLQSLLAERFKLVLHKETKPLPAMVLARSVGQPKLKKADESADSFCEEEPQSDDALVKFSCRNMSMEEFAEALQRLSNGQLSEAVVNATNLEGSWDFDLHWNPRSAVLPGTKRITVFDAIDQQLGLKLEMQPVPTPVIVVDRVNQVPTANPPGVAQRLPPRSIAFDVAAIKLSSPGEAFRLSRSPGGRLEMNAYPLKMLIATAWDIDWDHMDERIVAPKWADSKRFDIIASSSALPVRRRGGTFMDEDLQLMLRALLVDRFQISAHFEDRPVSTYSLKAVKPKLQKADPSNRSNCNEAGVIPHDPRDMNPRLSTLIQCQNISMAQFAQVLQGFDRMELTFNAIVDETGLDGSYDFTLNFTPRWELRDGEGGGGAEGAVTAASDPNGAISFTEAIRQQLGLKLETRKRPMPVLVIDHIEEKPTEN